MANRCPVCEGEGKEHSDGNGKPCRWCQGTGYAPQPLEERVAQLVAQRYTLARLLRTSMLHWERWQPLWRQKAYIADVLEESLTGKRRKRCPGSLGNFCVCRCGKHTQPKATGKNWTAPGVVSYEEKQARKRVSNDAGAGI